MPVIIISKGSYSHGGEVARKVAERLGYDCISRDILIETSKKFNVSELRLIRAVEDVPSFLEKYTFGRKKYINYVKAAILNNIANGNTVYHGFAGHVFVKDISHVIKVRIVADIEERLAYMMKRENVLKEEALRMVHKVDEERTKWGMKLYGIDPWDSRQYDQVINIGRITIDDAVDMICHTSGLKAFQPTVESQRQIEKFAIEAIRQAEDKNQISPFFEPLRDPPYSKSRKIEDD
jgi:cytidylate kinase